METGMCGNTGGVPVCVCTLERQGKDKVKVEITWAYAQLQIPHPIPPFLCPQADKRAVSGGGDVLEGSVIWQKEWPCV